MAAALGVRSPSLYNHVDGRDALRGAVHGFAALEANGGFGLDVDRDVSFQRRVDALARGIG